MTYTTVYKDYEGETIEQAAGKLFADDEVWVRIVSGGAHDLVIVEGSSGPYTIDRWEWAENRLRVWFR